MRKHAVIYWFSGTGNACRLSCIAGHELVRALAAPESLKADEIGCDVCPIEQRPGGMPDGRAEYAYTGIVSPVLGFGLPRNVVSFLRRLPPGDGRKAFVVIAMGNTETITLGSHRWNVPPTEGIAIRQARILLKRKGYDVIRAEAFEMPTNWILATNPPPPARAASLTARNVEKLEAFMANLVRGERYHRRVSPLYAIPFRLVYDLFTLIGRRYSGKWFFADESCNGCANCFSQCPQGTIRWRNNRPVWRWNCLQCFRCINLCPRSAIQVSCLAIVATVAPLLFAGYCYRHSLGMLLPHRWSLLGHAAYYFLISFIAVDMLHRLQCFPLTGRFTPRWPLTTHRTRYREPGFTPPERSHSA
jgi:NAD-dependent dihydropyrimidine dehydrogenase PreA subunit